MRLSEVPSPVLSTPLSYRLIAQDLDKSLARTAAEPVVARETAYYQANIGRVKSIDDLFADKRLYRYAMKAFGLADMSYAQGFMRKVLEGGVADSDALANRLSDSRYKDFATAFNFARYGANTTTFAAVNKGATDAYVRLSLEAKAGDQNDGVRLALYFQRKAPALTSAYGILADKALSQVVRTALGLPASSASIDIDAQAKMISNRLDIADFKDPAKLSKFLTRFTAMWEIANPTATANVPNIIVGQSSSGIGTDLLLSLSKLRLGGA